MSLSNMTYAEAINQAMHQAMGKDDSVICYGLGVDDPKAIFGTTEGLAEAFGNKRIFDMPTAENGMLGIGIGAAISGLKPVMVHQRLDFFLLAMDQLVNTAAKWYFMFGEQRSVPITIRLVIGRGWGQGPTHSQSLQAWFAHIPGLKVVMPTSPADAKGMLLSSIFDPNPVVFLEHRWLHNQVGDVEQDSTHIVPLDKAKVCRKGTDVTIVAMAYQVLEALRAAKELEENGISAEVIDMRCIQPIDWPTIFESVKKTGRLLVADSGMATCSVSSEVVCRVTTELFEELKSPPTRLALPDIPEPTSYGMTQDYYYGALEIAEEVHKMLDLAEENSGYESLKVQGHHDVPGGWFKGPF